MSLKKIKMFAKPISKENFKTYFTIFFENNYQ